MFSGGTKQNEATLIVRVWFDENVLNLAYKELFHQTDRKAKAKGYSGIHPAFPGDGVLILGQEQEKICGGFDDYDSLSADISEFQVKSPRMSGTVSTNNSVVT